MFNPSLDDMAEYARSLWLTTYDSSAVEAVAVAWMLKNRLLRSCCCDDRIVGRQRPRPRNETLLSRVCRDFVHEEYGAVSLEGEISVSFQNLFFSRAFSTACLVWSGDMEDPTNGAICCHRHDEAPDWSSDAKPTALIGTRLFYA